MERLLDTDILIELLHGRPDALAWFAALPNPPGGSGLAAMELYQGCRNGGEARDVERLLHPFVIVWPTQAHQQFALDAFPALYLRDGTGLLDMLTAQTAIGHGLTLCTFNVRHFRGITGLMTEIPYTR